MRADTSDEIRILFVGDTNFSESYQMRYQQEGGKNILAEKGYDWPFEKLRPILEQSDLVVANLETPITNILTSPISVQSKKNFHWTDVEKAPRYFKKYNMRVFSLANNHMLDYGLDGLKQTLEILKENSMESLGAGLSRAQARKPLIKDFGIGHNKHVRLAMISGFEYRRLYAQDSLAFYARKNMAGVNRISIKAIARQIQTLKERKSLSSLPDPVDTFLVVFPHWGSNYMWRSQRQNRLGHCIIDVGTDLIIGHGAHMMQEIERYKGRWIIYGLGNFMYNPRGRYEKFNAVPFGLVAQLILKRRYEETITITKSLRLYPIFTNNKMTNFQARFLTAAEFQQVYNILLDRSEPRDEFERMAKKGTDAIGHFIEIAV